MLLLAHSRRHLLIFMKNWQRIWKVSSFWKKLREFHWFFPSFHRWKKLPISKTKNFGALCSKRRGEWRRGRRGKFEGGREGVIERGRVDYGGGDSCGGDWHWENNRTSSSKRINSVFVGWGKSPSFLWDVCVCVCMCVSVCMYMWPTNQIVLFMKQFHNPSPPSLSLFQGYETWDNSSWEFSCSKNWSEEERKKGKQWWRKGRRRHISFTSDERQECGESKENCSLCGTLDTCILWSTTFPSFCGWLVGPERGDSANSRDLTSCYIWVWATETRNNLTTKQPQTNTQTKVNKQTN